MYNQNNMPARTRVSHYLRTGQLISERAILKGGVGCGAARLALSPFRPLLNQVVRSKWGKPNDVLVDHYFFSSGQTFDLVGRGLLSYITRTSVFQGARNRFLKQVQRDLLNEANGLCGRPQEDYIMGRAKSMKRFKRRLSDRQPINFTREFFSLGDSYIEMAVFADVEVNCITKGVSITGKIEYKINDWFKDADDINDAMPGDQEWICGTAYKMVAHWSKPISLSGRFR